MMYCNECGTKLAEGEKFCSNCGKKIEENTSQEETNKTKSKKIKFRVDDVVNKENVLNSTNKVAYIANGWALQIRNRGIDFASILAIISFFFSIAYASNEESALAFFVVFGASLLVSFIIVMIFNTIAFMVRMGAEVIQLLDDIKNKTVGNMSIEK